MIITQTPIRISFLGGGTDFREYFQDSGGCVLSTAIDKYIFVVIKERFDDLVRVAYTKTEIVERVEDLQHELVREALRKTGIDRRVEIATMADVPSEGSGLGSSSAVTVGLLNAMYAYREETASAEKLAREACEIEIDILGKPIGVQDQYIAAYGGFRFLTFNENGSVQVEPINVSDETRHRLNESLLLFFTGKSRRASDVLTEQKANISERKQILHELKNKALAGRACLESGDLETLGKLLHESWLLKKQMASCISDNHLDEIYQTAQRAGAIGGKLLGAGGGGFMLFCCAWECQERLRAALHGLRELPFRLERAGTKIILNYRRHIYG